MQAQSITSINASSQVLPMHDNNKHKRDATMSIIIDGCIVSFSSSGKDSDEAITAAKEILLSAYRTKTKRG